MATKSYKEHAVNYLITSITTSLFQRPHQVPHTDVINHYRGPLYLPEASMI